MSEFEKQKNHIAIQIKSLCAHCANQVQHTCRIQGLAEEVSKLSGVPLIVNETFHGLLFTNSDITIGAPTSI